MQALGDEYLLCAANCGLPIGITAHSLLRLFIYTAWSLAFLDISKCKKVFCYGEEEASTLQITALYLSRWPFLQAFYRYLTHVLQLYEIFIQINDL